MRAVYNALAAAAGISILAACTSGQSAIEPPSQGANVQTNSTLQFRVGTARHADGNVYFNSVVTFRQANGLSATLYNSPFITGPAGFTVPANNTLTTSTTVGSQPGTDAGTNTITATPPTQPGTTPVATTFNQTGGAFAYGFAPANSTTSGAANYSVVNLAQGANNAIYLDGTSAITTGSGKGNTQLNIAGGVGRYNNVYTQPLYLTTSRRLPFLIGPPAVPDFHSPSAGFPAGFLGYDSGFTMFAATPVAGTYTLRVDVPSNTIGQLAASFTTTSSLAVTPLPAMATPAITPLAKSPAACNGTGGGGATFVVAPVAAPVTNVVLYVVDVSASTGNPTHYTINAGTGGTFTLGATAGPSGGPPFCTGDSIVAWVVGADYDVLGAAVPNNTSPAPALPAQTDISVSLVNEAVE